MKRLTDRNAVFIALHIAIESETSLVNAYHDDKREEAVRDALKRIASFKRILKRYYPDLRFPNLFIGEKRINILELMAAPRRAFRKPR